MTGLSDARRTCTTPFASSRLSGTSSPRRTRIRERTWSIRRNRFYPQSAAHPQIAIRHWHDVGAGSHCGLMNATNGVLVMVTEPVMRADVDRVAAAAGVAVVHVSQPPSR